MRPFHAITTALLVAVCLATLAPAQTTDPVGFTTATVNGKPAGIRGFTFLSLDLTRLPVFQGVVPTVSTNGSNQTVLTFPAATFTASAFNTTAVGASHYVELTNGGGNAGRLVDIVSNTDSAITLAENVTALFPAGSATITLRPNWTFSTVFGTNNSAGLGGGSNAAVADIVQIFHPENGTTYLYFYNTSTSRWERLASPNNVDATNEPIPVNIAPRIERKLGTAVSFVLTGAVKLGPTGLFVKGGNTAGNPTNLQFLPNPYPLASKTFGTLNLYTGAPGTWLGASNAGSADTASLYDTASGTFKIYFYNTTNARWERLASPSNVDATNETIPDSAALFVKRKTTGSDFIWFVPQPTMNLN